jgi:hypothetical protein
MQGAKYAVAAAFSCELEFVPEPEWYCGFA